MKPPGKETTRTEIRDGVEFIVTVLPEAKPPKRRDGRSHYHYVDVGKEGDVPPSGARKRKGKRRRRGRSSP